MDRDRVNPAGMNSSGGPRLREFWQRYKAWLPEHEIFSHEHFCEETFIPLLVHGDGGRTYRKEELMVAQFQPILGWGTRLSHPLPNAQRAGVNLRAHSFTTRFLFGVLQKGIYKDDSSAFTCFFDGFMANLSKLYSQGLQLQGKHFHFATLGVKGDLPFLQRAGHLERTFLNVRKAPETAKSKKLTGCCHCCLAGTPGVAFEDFSSSAAWMATTGPACPYPWASIPPFMEYTPHLRSDAGSFFRFDILHVYHLGMGRDFSGSSLVILLGLYQADSIAGALDLLTADLQLFLKQTKKQLHFKTFSREMLGYGNEHSFPSGHWSKAMDTPVIMEFILWLLNKHPDKMQQDKLLRVIFAGADSMGLFMRTVLQGNLWLTTEEATTASEAGLHFLQSYAKCVKICLQRSLCRYNLTPKLHFWHHICFTLQQSCSRGLDWHWNPLIDSNFSDEDFVGRVSRLSRRVSARRQCLRTIGRYLVATRAQLDDDQGG